MKIIPLNKTTKIVLRATSTKTIIIPEIAINVSEIILKEIIDDGVSAYANIYFSTTDTNLKHVLLWGGQEYINIGQWQDEDVLNKLNEIYCPVVTPTEPVVTPTEPTNP